MTRKTFLSAESVAVIAYLRTHGQTTERVLCARFSDEVRGALLKRLSGLCACGWLDFGWNDDGDKHWFVRPSARTAVAAVVAEPPEAPNLVLPRRINVMAGHYQPSQWQTHRAGAQDHLSVPSLRGTQRVVHQGTYLFR